MNRIVDFSGAPGVAHLIGIGGAGMRSLARVLLDRRWKVTGSDCGLESGFFDRLPNVCYYAGHSAKHLSAATTLVVYSSAIDSDNVELHRASELNIPALSFARALGGLMTDRMGLAVAGTHGKSTSTAMAADILMLAGRDPTFVYGAQSRVDERYANSSSGKVVLVEACEFRENFLHLRPQQAVILNIDWDHVDFFPSFQAVKDTFTRFAVLLPPTGRLIVPASDPASERLIQSAACSVETFAVNQNATWQAINLQESSGRFRFDLYRLRKKLGTVSLSVPGQHNVANALAAAALVGELGIEPRDICMALTQFQGLRRRLETIAFCNGITWIDDYAHHPAETSASLATIRAMHPAQKIYCVFQPHQAARTAQFLGQFAQSLQNADEVVIADIFRAREGDRRASEVSAADLAREVRMCGRCPPPIHTQADIASFLQTQLTSGDVLVTMGAGDIGRIGYDLMERFKNGRAAQ